jgi:hypothetical protein
MRHAVVTKDPLNMVRSVSRYKFSALLNYPLNHPANFSLKYQHSNYNQHIALLIFQNYGHKTKSIRGPLFGHKYWECLHILNVMIIFIQTVTTLGSFKNFVFFWRSRYSDCLQAGWPRGRSSSPGRVKHFLFFMLSKAIPGPTQPRIHTGGSFSGGKAAGAWSWPLISN